MQYKIEIYSNGELWVEGVSNDTACLEAMRKNLPVPATATVRRFVWDGASWLPALADWKHCHTRYFRGKWYRKDQIGEDWKGPFDCFEEAAK